MTPLLAHHVFWDIATGEFVSIVIALLVAIPATIAAWTSRKNRAQMRTSNGHTAGQLLDELREDMGLLKMWMIEHMRTHDLHVRNSDDPSKNRDEAHIDHDA